VQPLIVSLPEVDNINVGLVHRLDVALVWIDPHRNSAIDARHSNTVARLNAVHLKSLNPFFNVESLQSGWGKNRTGFSGTFRTTEK